MPDLMQEPITVFKQGPSSSKSSSSSTRYSDLVKSFEVKYGIKPSYVARAPGRVSVIGEHIDYAGLSVMPAAIDRDVMQACSFKTSSNNNKDNNNMSTINISNVNPKFPSEVLEFEIGKNGPLLDPKAHSWVNYFKAGLKGALGHMPANRSNQAIELNILVDGNVPPGGGLSSSAAMVVSSALATLQAYGAIDETTQGQLAEIAINSERLVGVNSGGMDQSASIFSRENALLNVGFVPKLVATLVPFPKTTPNITYVIANSLVTSEKQKTAKYHYNLRVVEMRVVARLLADHLHLQLPITQVEGGGMPTVKHVMDAYFASNTMHTSSDFLIERKRRLKIMLDIVEDLFGNKKDGNSWEEVYELLGGMDEQGFKKIFHDDFEIEADRLQLYRRAKHAYSEAIRVYQYRGLLETAKDNDPELASKLGNLMNESQTSCHELYDCSCPEIEEICTIARKAGSLGSRVSGAGWGGCTVHLVTEDLQDKLIQTLRAEYYNKRFPDLTEEQLAESIFATKPEEGACLYVLD